MTYEELKLLHPDILVRAEMNGVNQDVDTSQASSLTEYDAAMIKRMYETVFPVKETDSRFEEVANFIEKLK